MSKITKKITHYSITKFFIVIFINFNSIFIHSNQIFSKNSQENPMNSTNIFSPHFFDSQNSLLNALKSRKIKLESKTKNNLK
jgi:hypothetical protein